jgi:hypothetical protein
VKVSLLRKILSDSIRVPLAIWLRKRGITTAIKSALHLSEMRRLSADNRNLKPVLSEAKVLIICAHFNHLKWLPGCIDSVLAQNHQAWQLLIVDDCSTDSSADTILREQANCDPRIKAITLSENSGAYIARNTGIEAADLDWTHVTFIDPDDVATPEWLEHSLMILKGRQGTVRPSLERWTPDFSKMKSIYFGHCQSMHTRFAWERAGGFLPIRRSADAELTARLGHLAKDGKTTVYKSWLTAQRMRLVPGSASTQDLVARKVWLEQRDDELSTLAHSDLKIVPKTTQWKDCSDY